MYYFSLIDGRMRAFHREQTVKKIRTKIINYMTASKYIHTTKLFNCKEVLKICLSHHSEQLEQCWNSLKVHSDAINCASCFVQVWICFEKWLQLFGLISWHSVLERIWIKGSYLSQWLPQGERWPPKESKSWCIEILHGGSH